MEPPSYNQNKTGASNAHPSIRRQAAKDKKSLEAYENWTSQMNDSQRQELKDLGLEKLKITYFAKGGPKQDAAESAAASYEPDYAAIIDGEDESGPAYLAGRDVCDVLRHVFAELMAHDNVRLTFDCFMLVFKFNFNQGKSMTEMAQLNGVSTQAFSDRCIHLCEEFGIEPPPAMKKKKAKNPEKGTSPQPRPPKLP